MDPVVTASQSREADEYTIQTHGVPSLVLMERAALACVDEMEKRGLLGQKIGVACGAGNNGGDGLAIARLLHLRGADVMVYQAGSWNKMTQDCTRQRDICKTYQVRFSDSQQELLQCRVIVDAIFGVGLSREVTGDHADLIRRINEAPAFKVAVDMPSGVSADSGKRLGEALAADLTVTFAFAKAGQLVYPGKKYCGELVVSDIGITPDPKKQPDCFRCTPDDLGHLSPLLADDHKGSRGRVLCIAGSRGMGGAACLCAHAALASGCGMVRIYTPSCNREAILSRLPEALVDGYETYREEMLLAAMEWADSIVIGPGLGTDETAEAIVDCVFRRASLPLLADADALTLLARRPELFHETSAPLILTPHMGEMARLLSVSLQDVLDDRLKICRSFAKEYGVTLVLKDAATMTALADGRLFLNDSGNAGMATAGSGDVLAGILAGLRAQGTAGEWAAPLGVYLHGLAGDCAAQENSMRGMTASDLIAGMKTIYKERGM